MRCLVVGCGSIGSRRARVLAEMGHEVWAFDTDEKKVDALYPGTTIIPSYGPNYWIGPGDGYDVAFICTPPDVRLEPIRGCIQKSNLKGLFVEKPLALDMTTANAILGLLEGANVVDMGACNMRYDGRLAGFALPEETKTVEYRMGQHSKYWSANHQPISLILDDIHELDLALHFARSPVKEYAGWSNKDMAACWFKHRNGTKSIVHLDRETDPPERWIMWASKTDVLGKINLWPGDPEMYRREMEDFLKCVELGKPSPNPLSQAAEVLGWALEVAG